MPRQPKAKPEAYGQKKTERFQVLVTAEGLEILDSLAAKLGLSRGEFVERSARWINEHFDDQLQRDLSDPQNEEAES